MNETKFTPGPWTLTEGFKTKVFAQSESMTVCDIRGWGYLTGVGGLHLPSDEAVAIQDANAHLIAAAPELYEACERVIGIVEFGRLNADELAAMLVHLKTVLKKARGEQ